MSSHEGTAIDDLWVAGWTAEEAGRHDEALALWARAADRGSVEAMESLGHALMEAGPDGYEQGVRWMTRSADLGNETAAIYLAMEARLRNDPASYRKWMERAGALGSRQAAQIVQAISGEIAEGRDWPMYLYAWVDLDEVWGRLQEFQDGEMDGPGLVDWARGIVERRTALGVGGAHAAVARDALRDIAESDGDHGTAVRVKELLFKFNALPDQA